ncbi:MAG: hypothetical protein ACK4PR_11810, partial [Gammaproteobacteria bacterium]
FISSVNKSISPQSLTGHCRLLNKVAINTPDHPKDKLRILLIAYLNCASMPDVPAANKTLLIQHAAELFHQAHTDLHLDDYTNIFTANNVNSDVVRAATEQVYALSKIPTRFSTEQAVISNTTKSTAIIQNILKVVPNMAVTSAERDSVIKTAERALNNIQLIDEYTGQAATSKLQAEINNLTDFSEIDNTLKTLQETFPQQMPRPNEEVQQAMKFASDIQQQRVAIEFSINENLSEDKKSVSHTLSLSKNKQLKETLLAQKNTLLSSSPGQARKALEIFRKECQQIFSVLATSLYQLANQKDLLKENLEDSYIDAPQILKNIGHEFQKKSQSIKQKRTTILTNSLKSYITAEDSLDKNAKEANQIATKIDNFINQLDTAQANAESNMLTITTAKTAFEQAQTKLNDIDTVSKNAASNAMADLKVVVTDLQTQLNKTVQLLRESKKMDADFATADALLVELQLVCLTAEQTYKVVEQRFANSINSDKAKYDAILPTTIKQVNAILDKVKLANQDTAYKELTALAETCNKQLSALDKQLADIETLQSNTQQLVTEIEKNKDTFSTIKQDFATKIQSVTNQITHAIQKAEYDRLSQEAIVLATGLNNEVAAIHT